MPLPRTTVEPKFRLVFGSILTLNWITGLILASCFFMPLAVGCQNTVIYPTELAVALGCGGRFPRLQSQGISNHLRAMQGESDQ